MDKKLKRYFEVARRMEQGIATPEDTQYFLTYSNDLDQSKIDAAIKQGLAGSQADAQAIISAAGTALQTRPEYREHLLEIQKQADRGELTSELAQGVGLVLAGTDIAQSITQIQQSKNLQRQSTRPSRPRGRGRDQYLAQQLREAQEASNEAGRALAPAEAQIADAYNQDIANARIASGGQAGAFGSYAQLATDARRRAAADLVPMADNVRARRDARVDSLVEQRLRETQNQFENEAALYPTELQNYLAEQQAAGQLGATGRANLRDSLYGAAQLAVPTAAELETERRYRRMHAEAAARYGEEAATTMVEADKRLNADYARKRKRPGIAKYGITNPLSGERIMHSYNPEI